MSQQTNLSYRGKKVWNAHKRGMKMWQFYCFVLFSWWCMRSFNRLKLVYFEVISLRHRNKKVHYRSSLLFFFSNQLTAVLRNLADTSSGRDRFLTYNVISGLVLLMNSYPGDSDLMLNISRIFRLLFYFVTVLWRAKIIIIIKSCYSWRCAPYRSKVIVFEGCNCHQHQQTMSSPDPELSGKTILKQKRKQVY